MKTFCYLLLLAGMAFHFAASDASGWGQLIFSLLLGLGLASGISWAYRALKQRNL
jgi:hypothetical protein